MTKEQEEAIERINNDIAKPLYCGDITICNIDDLKTVLSMLEEKDKQIDLMAVYIEQIDASGDLCKGCKEIDYNEDDDHCKVCIKQYFENEAKEK